ncbi:hypothetical protein C0J52_08360 [Blattella germanica]|nr:hypothetical protein C0J52_08360 [Blattella germanica]
MINERCIKESQYYLQEFNNFSLWALKRNRTKAKVLKHEDPIMKPGHRVPCFSSIHWALCIPAACTAKDVEIALSDLLQKHTENTGISLKVRVAPEMCQVQADGWFNIPASTLIVGVFFVSIGILAFFATLCDPEWNERDIKDLKLSTRRQVVQAFSLRKNVLILLSLSRHPDDVESVHGLRAINALLLFIAHKCMALFFNPYLDRTYMAENPAESSGSDALCHIHLALDWERSPLE